ncbi:MAG: cytidylate kinase-like family protein [Bacteroidota bacterium]
MENILLKYMVERFNEAEHVNQTQIHNFPFITISREYGCPSKDIALLIVQKLNSHLKLKNHLPSWRMINKEILEETSKELKVDTKRIQKFFNIENRSTIEEILTSLSEKYYHSNKKIKKTLTVIITDFAKTGNVVIVGRGGVCVTNNLKNGIHIRLTAPIDWRADSIIQMKKATSIADAKKLAEEIDFKRTELLKIMSDNSYKDTFFDLTYNCQSFSKEEIAESIVYHLILKGKIKI